MQTLSVSVSGVVNDPQLVESYRELGVTRSIMRLPSEGRNTVLPLLDEYAKLLS